MDELGQAIDPVRSKLNCSNHYYQRVRHFALARANSLEVLSWRNYDANNAADVNKLVRKQQCKANN